MGKQQGRIDQLVAVMASQPFSITSTMGRTCNRHTRGGGRGMLCSD